MKNAVSFGEKGGRAGRLRHGRGRDQQRVIDRRRASIGIEHIHKQPPGTEDGGNPAVSIPNGG